MTTLENQAVPQAIDAEKAVLGAMILNPKIIDAVSNALLAEHFYRPQHAETFTTLAAMATAGEPMDQLTISARLRDNGTLSKLGGHGALFSIVEATPTATNWLYWAEEVRATWRRRKIVESATRLIQAATTPTDDDQFLDVAAKQSLELELTIDDKLADLEVADLWTFDEFLNRPVTAEDWIVPGLIARQDVVMLLGGEGAGKSWMSRQVAQCIAAGIHPFRPDVKIPPMRPMLVDLEVSEQTLLDEMKPMSHQVARLGNWVGDNGYVWHHPQGLNLRDRRDQVEFERRIEIARPDVILLGSLYNAYFTGRDSHEMVADELRVFFNRIRSRYRCALWLEHHMPKGDGTHRPATPFGSSVWMRWCTHGLVMQYVNGNLYELGRFRGNRGQRDYPAGIHRGGQLPVSPIYDQAEIDLAKEAGR